MALRRINLNLDESLLNALDDYAKTFHITRSAAISILLCQFFEGQKLISSLENLNMSKKQIEKRIQQMKIIEPKEKHTP